MRRSFLNAMLVYCACLFTGQVYASLPEEVSYNQPYTNTSVHNPHILVLHSYDPSYEWTADIQRGISYAFQNSNTVIAPSIEYLDTKRNHRDDYFEDLKKFLEVKYKDYYFDGIIITDDRALKFMNEFNSELVRNVPTVAVGINDRQASLNSITNINTILYEEDNILENLKIIIRIRPNIKKLYLLSDNSLTSTIVRNEIKKHFNIYQNIQLVELTAETLEQARNVLGSASSEDAVLLTHFNSEIEEGVFHSYDKIARKIADSSEAPVFVLWEHNIKGDVLGGRVQDPFLLGVTAAKLLAKDVPLNLSEDLPSAKQHSDIFNFRALKRFGIPAYSLPTNAFVINKPSSFIEDNLEMLVYSGTIISILIVIIALQSVSIRQKKELANKNQKIFELHEKTLKVQKDMIHVLGEAIESRSGETGNHVKRVAKLSSYLAKLYGMNKADCELIEVITPMHDVGKIAIPESILDKPGRLNDNEWEVMKTHTISGFNLLNSSDGDVMALAAIVALEHHEHWDGNGYPNGKKGSDIHIYARITAIADVFDALLSRRSYKSEWDISSVTEYFLEKQGKQFDPDLTSLLIENIDEFVKIRHEHPDNVVRLERAM
ncbi:putative Metal dependent phosphohydrolase [Vibrio nigripulchritudo SOn1]|uniref:Metal dependent phosphohydrolase n=1 Tax=Vibrio nigripulchritudo SOn1 TaxID=1238450 RepID=A0AAV2VMX2_9VIBR|nr:HD domain-containing phosphohydrolase [Vibrio nigripulchritudo]CCO46066.1 putative Metal dependent phosphohydrolase [Vibrio nigripulchritudo SOn1]